MSVNAEALLFVTLSTARMGGKRVRLKCATAVRLCAAASFCFGARIWLGTILGRFSIIYFSGLGLRIRVMVWVRVRVSVVIWSL